MRIGERLKEAGVARSVFGGPRTLEEIEERDRAEHIRLVREERLRVARSTARWTELEGVDLVARGKRFVGASDDRVYRPDPPGAVVFAKDSATVVDEVRALYFRVDAGRDIQFFERERETWSQVVARRAGRRRL